MIGWVLASLIGLATVLVGREIARTRAAAARDVQRVGQGGAIFLVAFHTQANGTPTARYLARIEVARRMWEQTRLPIWCLGGRLANRERTNGEDTKRWLAKLGVPAGAARTIDEFPFLGESLETVQEAVAASELAARLHVQCLVVISDILQLAQVRLVMPPSLDLILVRSPLGVSGTRVDPYYWCVRCGALLVTVFDRRGWPLGWLRAWRRGGLRPQHSID